MYVRIILLLTVLNIAYFGQTAAQPSVARTRGRCVLGLNLSAPETETAGRRIAPARCNAVFDNSSAEPEVIRIDTDLVLFELDVRDRRGRRVAGLTASDFVVEENGIPQNIEVFSASGASEAVGRSIILIVDYSNSQSPYIGTSIAAAKTLLKMLEPNDRMAIVTDDVELLVNFTSDKTELERQLDKLHESSSSGTYGESMQFTALFRAIGELFDRGEKRPVVIFQTDGDEFPRISHRIKTDEAKCPTEFNRFDLLEQLIERSGTKIHSIIPGIRYDVLMEQTGQRGVWAAAESEVTGNPLYAARITRDSGKRLSPRFLKAWVKSRLRDTAAVEHIAKISGGTTHFLEHPDQAQIVYSSILNVMNERYLVGYYPASSILDGARRSVRVRLRTGLEYKIHGRSSDGGLRRPN